MPLWSWNQYWVMMSVSRDKINFRGQYSFKLRYSEIVAASTPSNCDMPKLSRPVRLQTAICRNCRGQYAFKLRYAEIIAASTPSNYDMSLFHDYHIQECEVLQCGRYLPTFRRNVLPHFSGYSSKPHGKVTINLYHTTPRYVPENDPISCKEIVEYLHHVARFSDFLRESRRLSIRGIWSSISAVFNLFCSRTPTYNFSSTLYPQSCWCTIQVIHSL
jgi:uncharacterized protein YegP (UPF0339 family)